MAGKGIPADYVARRKEARMMRGVALRILSSIVVDVPKGSLRNDGKTNAEIADLVEYGTRKMPPRPFRRNAPIVYEAKWKRLRGHYAQAVGNKSMDIKEAVSELGWEMVIDTRRLMIRYGIYDTGQLYRSIRAIVRM